MELLLGIPAVPILQPSVGVSHETSYPRQHKMEIRGLPLAEDDGVRWSIAENSKQKSGIPDIIPCAILAVYDGEPFQAEVKIKIRTDSLFSISANPWSKDDPVLLRPNASFGETRLDPQLERMTTEDWEKLVKFSAGTTVRHLGGNECCSTLHGGTDCVNRKHTLAESGGGCGE